MCFGLRKRLTAHVFPTPGTHYFLLQLSICDIASLIVGAIELVYIQQQRWTFPPEMCPLYLGLESFSSIATVYLLVALNFHTISTYTLARRTMQREERQQQQHLLPTEHNDDNDDGDDDCGDADDSSGAGGGGGGSSASSLSENHYAPILADTPPASASASDINDGYETPIREPEHTYQRPTACHQPSHPQTRSLTIDYSQRQTGVSVVLPVLFVWFVAASASTPLFAFGSVLPSRRVNGPPLCGVVNFDPQNNRLLQAMVLAVRVVLPSACVLLTAAAVAVALRACRTRVRPCGLEENVREILRLALVLSLVYGLASEQRALGSVLFEVWSVRPLMLPKYPRWKGAVAMALSMLHWSASTVRPLVYWAMDGALRSEVRRTLCWRTGRSKSGSGGNGG